jgi:hypothetical protein
LDKNSIRPFFIFVIKPKLKDIEIPVDKPGTFAYADNVKRFSG